MSDKQPYIGGQAVIEGVMMRSPHCLSVAVRRPDGAIALREGPFKSRFDSKVWKLPGLRGIATLAEALKMGFGALRFSAEQQMTEEERAQDAGSASKLAMFVGILLAVLLFKVLPQALAGWSFDLAGQEYSLQSSLFHLVIGSYQFLVLLGYLSFINMLPDGRRLFQYHGAEHKTINAYEQGLALTVGNVRDQTTLHPRCGTTFLVMIVFISILAGSVVTPLVLPHADGTVGWLQTLVLRLTLIGPIAAVSFELQRVFARFCTRGPLRLFLWPGFLFQKITTREPDDQQIEIAIAAMKVAEWRETVGSDAPIDDEPLVFSSFAVFSESLPELRSKQLSAA